MSRLGAKYLGEDDLDYMTLFEACALLEANLPDHPATHNLRRVVSLAEILYAEKVEILPVVSALSRDIDNCSHFEPGHPGTSLTVALAEYAAIPKVSHLAMEASALRRELATLQQQAAELQVHLDTLSTRKD